MSFQGEFNNTIDAKGRASIPAKFREVLADVYTDERLVVTKNLENGLSAYPQSCWEEIVERLKNSPASPNKEAMIQFMVSPAVECTFDKQGRIQIPQSLRSFAALDKEVVVVGVFDKVKIYSQITFAEVSRKHADLLKSDPQVVADMGF